MLTPATRDDIVKLINTHAKLQQLRMELRDEPGFIKVTIGQIDCDFPVMLLAEIVEDAIDAGIANAEAGLHGFGLKLNRQE